MAYIGAEPVPGQNREIDDISSGFNGSATAFTLQVSSTNVSPETANNILVNLGGVMQNPGTDYTIAASTITFTTAPASGLSFWALILGAGINTATVADDTIGSSKLIDTAVTAGSYTTADITVDAKGRITAAASGSISGAEIANNAVTTAKIADSTGASDGVTAAKIATSAITTAKIADQAVDLSKLPHGTGSNDGKFLRANNGADPTFETVTGTTINNNADNRVITGSGTANTLEAESNLHAVNGRLLIGTSSEQTLPYTSSGAIQTLGAYNTSSINIVNNENSGNTSALTFNKIRGASGSAGGTDVMGGINWGAYDGSTWRSGITVEGRLTSIGSNAVPSKLTFKINSGSSNTERFAITPNGVTFNGDTAAANALDDYEEGTYSVTITGASGGSATLANNSGAYTKIGRMVTVNMNVSLTNKNTLSGTVQVSLPFTVADDLTGTSLEANGIIVYFANLASNSSFLGLSPISGGTIAQMRGVKAQYAVTAANFTDGDFNNNTEFRATVTYFTAT